MHSTRKCILCNKEHSVIVTNFIENVVASKGCCEDCADKITKRIKHEVVARYEDVFVYAQCSNCLKQIDKLDDLKQFTTTHSRSFFCNNCLKEVIEDLNA
jgi:hypothetical protein